ncbi:hypothetical protein CVT26_012194 [Gymnopilus dilepis]|uniref:Uncharacterized protein n=1 Tax=Gymnopilus dilepis TaxID=231916 RepID=A0A409W9G6_9AGAR|nr:hypothetical protein CVT26_012194 [Gymnopilus dilepis]
MICGAACAAGSHPTAFPTPSEVKDSPGCPSMKNIASWDDLWIFRGDLNHGGSASYVALERLRAQTVEVE